MNEPERIQHMIWNYKRHPSCLLSFMLRDTTLCSGNGYGLDSCEHYNEFCICTNRHYTSYIK